MQTKSLYIILASVLILGSCAPAYIPNVVNSPMLKERGDMNFSVHSGTSGFDVQTSGAITNNIGLMINGSFADRTSDSTDDFHKHRFFEIAPGYFKKISRVGVVELYGGYGMGEIETFYDNNIFTNYGKADYTRFFIQPGIGIANDFVNASFSARISHVIIKQNNKSEDGTFLEPALTGKFGYKWVMFCCQVGLSIPFDDENIKFEYQPFIISLGMQFNLGTMIKGN